MDIGKIEYRVRPVTRYVVTRYYEYAAGTGGGVETLGEYDNQELAYQVGYALAKQEHARIGWPLGDERIKYPALVPMGQPIGGVNLTAWPEGMKPPQCRNESPPQTT